MLEDFKNLFRNGNFIGQVIVICAIVFVVQNIISNISLEAGQELARWFAMHTYLPSVITSPWSIFTYMFMHGSFSHIFWNMIVLYYFGRIVMDMMGRSRMMGIYFLGGFSGALFVLVAYSLQVLWGQPIVDKPLVGASAAIMAVVAFAAFRFGDFQMNMILIGPVKLRYVALGIFVASTLVDLAQNTGGKLAHFGGAAFGYFYYRTLNNGKDYAMVFSNISQSFVDFFKKKPTLRVVDNDQKTHRTKSSTSSKEEASRIDAILDKISKSGYDNLTKEEKEYLFKVSNKK